MNLKLLIVLLGLFLTACGGRSVRDDSPASDLDVLLANVRADGGRVMLPNGREYCAEDASVQAEMDECTGDLEDALWRANNRGERQVSTVERFVARERLRRSPCGWWERVVRRADRCRVE